MTKVIVEPSGCWRWKGSLNGSGYGSFGLNGRNLMAHRAAYELFVGPIPEGLHIDHLCRNRACVNPAHLEPVTPAENVRRWAREITHCPAGHEYTAKTTRVGALGGRACLVCHRDRERRRRGVGDPAKRARRCRTCGVSWEARTPGCEACRGRHKERQRRVPVRTQ